MTGKTKADPRVTERVTEVVVCRDRRSAACLEGQGSEWIYGPLGMAGDRSFDGASVICDECYCARGVPILRVGEEYPTLEDEYGISLARQAAGMSTTSAAILDTGPREDGHRAGDAGRARRRLYRIRRGGVPLRRRGRLTSLYCRTEARELLEAAQLAMGLDDDVMHDIRRTARLMLLQADKGNKGGWHYGIRSVSVERPDIRFARQGDFF